MIEQMKKEWFSNVKGDILAGIVVALALIPEAIAFSIIAGIDPMMGLYASFCMAVTIAFFGGRPGMISAATGAMALVIVSLVKDYGVEYLLAATLLTGVLQIVFSVCKVARLTKFIPRAVMIGFVNALAILIFKAQVPHFVGISTMTYVFVAITLAIVYIVPRFVKCVPAPLIAIVTLTAVSIFAKVELGTVGDLGEITKSLPSFHLPQVPFTIETLLIILPYSVALAIVGLVETLLTASIVDEMTDTKSNKNQEARGQGIGNIICGLFGGMASCAMIGQSVINVKSGGRGRLSTFVSGVFLMFLIIVLGDLVVKIPMPVLAGIMIMVSIGTFDWSSFSYLRKAPKSDAVVMISTVIVVIVTRDLSMGVIEGVILSALFFASKIAKIIVVKTEKNNSTIYAVEGQLFFASVEEFLASIDLTQKDSDIIISFENSNVWDSSGVGAIDKIVLKLKGNNNKVSVQGLNHNSNELVGRLGVYDNPNAKLSAH